MQEHETIQGYLETVQEQIRWKRARPVVAQELEQHLNDQRDAFVRDGKPPEEAERLAVADMGDPVEVGAGLDAVHRPRPQWGLLALTLALSIAGAALRVSLTSRWQASIGLGETVLALVLGTAALLGMYFLDISRLARHTRWVLPAALAAGILSLFLSPSHNNVPYYARYIVLLYPVVYPFWLYSLRRKGWIGFSLAVAGGAALAFVCLMVPYIQAAVSLLFIGFILLLYAIWQNWFGISKKAATFAALLIAFSITASFAFLVSQGLGAARLRTAFHPEIDPLCYGYHGMAIRRVLEASQWFGEGTLDTGKFSFEQFLPEAAYDMFPTTLIYHLGWVPYLLLLAALAALLVWLVLRGLRHTHQLGGMVVRAVALTLGTQMLGSIVLNNGIVLFSTHLPFLVGNLHTILDMALTGLALSVLRGGSIAREEYPGPLRRMHIRLKIEYT